MTPAAYWFPWRTVERESGKKTPTGYSIRCSRQRRRVWVWACRFAARLSKPIMAICGFLPTHPRAPSFSLCCPPMVRRQLVLHDGSNPKTPCLVRVSDADEIIDDRIDTFGTIGAL